MDEALTLLASGVDGPDTLDALRRAKESVLSSGSHATRREATETWNYAIVLRDARTGAAARDLGLALMRRSVGDELERGVLDDESFVQLLAMTVQTARAFWRAGESNMASSLVSDGEALAVRAPKVMARRLDVQRSECMAMHACTRLLMVQPPSKRAISAILEGIRRLPLATAKEQLLNAVNDATDVGVGLETVPAIVECLAAWDRALALAVGTQALESCMDCGRPEHASACAQLLRAHPALGQSRPGRVLDALRMMSTGAAPSDVVSLLSVGEDASDVLLLARVSPDSTTSVRLLRSACERAERWSAENALSVAGQLLRAGRACDSAVLAEAVASSVRLLSGYAAVWPKVPTTNVQRLLVDAARELCQEKRWMDALHAVDAALSMKCDNVHEKSKVDVSGGANAICNDQSGEYRLVNASILAGGADALCDERSAQERLVSEARALKARVLVRLGRFSEAQSTGGTSVAVRIEILLATGDEEGARRLCAVESGALSDGDVRCVAQMFEGVDACFALSLLCDRAGSEETATEALVLASKVGGSSVSERVLALVEKLAVDCVRRKLLDDAAEMPSRALDAAWNAALDMQESGQHALVCAVARSCLRVAGRGSRAAMFSALYLQNALLMDEDDPSVVAIADRCLSALGAADLDDEARTAVTDLCNAACMAAGLSAGVDVAASASGASEAAIEMALSHHIRAAKQASAPRVPPLLRELASRSLHGPDAAGLCRFAVLLRGLVCAASVELAESVPGSADALLDLFASGCEAVQSSGEAYPRDEAAWLCASAYNAALMVMREGGSQAAAIARQALALCTCLSPGPLRAAYEPSVRTLYKRAVIALADIASGKH